MKFMEIEMRLVFVILALVASLTACEKKSQTQDTWSPNARLIVNCVNGVEYFIMPAPGTGGYYPVTPVFDAETLKPRKCFGL